ncbi:MAG: hypothetical protein H7Y86_11550 [Rhizobacter sp.]|nr:hypothetical protein [Ferruginibacter sp.]
MRLLYFIMIFLCVVMEGMAQVQNKITPIIEGGKTLVELISIFKKKPAASTNSDDNIKADSCNSKQIADLCFKNSSLKDIVVSVYKRNESGYDAVPFTMRVIAQKRECWYDLRTGIYKYKIEIDSAGIKTLFIEGDMKLQSCDKIQREITW